MTGKKSAIWALVSLAVYVCKSS